MTIGFLDSVVTLSIAAGLLLVAGVIMLRKRWLARRRSGLAYLIGGWLALVGSVPILSNAWGAELGTTYMLIALSLAAYLVIGLTLERRVSKQRAAREATVDPEERPSNWGCGTGKALLAIVLAGIASVGLGVAAAIHLPLPPQDRAVIGGLLVPILWGGGMAWTLCDPRLLRATVILLTISALGYGVAFLPKVLA